MKDLLRSEIRRILLGYIAYDEEQHLGAPYLMYYNAGGINPETNYKGERIGIREARKHAAWYTKGLRGGAQYRAKMSMINSIDELKELAFLLLKENVE